MYRLVLAVGAITFLAAASTPVYAQSAVDQSHRARDAELQQWIDDFTAWQKWWAEWANRPEPGMLTSSRPRRVKPEPPPWLAGECDQVFDPAGPLETACELLMQWRRDDLIRTPQAATFGGVVHAGEQSKTIWWEYIHVDLLWPATELRGDVFGVIGMHTAKTIKGRMQVFLTPGVMLLNVPAVDGSRVWKIAANYGLGYRLFDLKLPGNRPASIYLNIAKSYMVSDTSDLLVSRSVDFAGFSVTFKRR
jgi:hypothetical protein